MIWWLRAHAALTCAVVLGACMICAPLLADSNLPVPSLFSGSSGGIPVPLVLPVFPACAMLYGLKRTPWESGAAAVRSVQCWEAGTAVVAGCTVLVVASVEGILLDFPLGFAAARNFLGYLGTGLLVQRFADAQYGPVTVAAVPIVCGLIGLGPAGRPYPWMWPAHTSGSPLAAAAAGVLFCLGLAAAITQRSERRRKG
ncbi:hypothetical protein [Streptomyces cucumeris]|uniref:hypothetical protein n=1 Tax=Streptomyces cucumeris TaxID=2962890 RepID=UPI0020C8BBBF|nr:hypothetical protein [Streptomyces sp. NEAU-Y11]MCP9208759.1 hypothetical protein [Streptomyces sp. NEAU-Y11]